MKTKKAEINVSGNVSINKSQVGFYRVKYDNNIFNKLIKSNLDFTEKLGLLNDVYALCRGCYLPLENFFRLAYSYRNETNHTIWDDLSVSLGRITLSFSDKYKNELNKFKIKLFSNIFKKLGWDQKPSDKHTDILLRSNVLGMLGSAEHKEVLNEAVKRFDEFLKGKKIDPNLRSVVYGLAAYNDGKEVFNKLKELYIKEKLQEEKIRLLLSLGDFKQKELLKETLEFSLSKHVRSQDTIYLITAIGVSDYADNLAWEFLKKNWKEFYKRYSDSHTMPNLIKACTLRFKTLDKLNDVKEYFKKHDVPTAKLAIRQILEIIQVNYNMVKYNESKLKDWLSNIIT